MHGKRPHQVISLARPLKIWLQCWRDSVIKKRPVKRAFFQFFLLKKKKNRKDNRHRQQQQRKKTLVEKSLKCPSKLLSLAGLLKSGQNWKLIEYQWSHGISSGETGFEWFWAQSDLMHLLFHTKFTTSKTSSLLKEARMKTSISSRNKK